MYYNLIIQKYLLFFFLAHSIPSTDLTYIIFFINGISDNITIYFVNKMLHEYCCKYIYGEFSYYMILLIHYETYILLYYHIRYHYFQYYYLLLFIHVDIIIESHTVYYIIITHKI